jgi:hypothetical protein
MAKPTARRGYAPKGSLGAPDMFLYIDHPEVLDGHLPGCPRVLTIEVIGSGIAHRDGIRWHALDDRNTQPCDCCGGQAGAGGWTYLAAKEQRDLSHWVVMCAGCTHAEPSEDAAHVRPSTHGQPTNDDRALGLRYPKPSYLTVPEALVREAAIFAAEDERIARLDAWTPPGVRRRKEEQQ